MDEAVDPDAPEPGPEPAAAAEVAPNGVAPQALLRLRRFSLLIIVAIVCALVFAFVRSTIRGPTGPWMGEYFEGKDFEGEPRIRYTRKLEFEWDKGRPFRGMPKDKWSAIYTTCLEVDEEAEYRFRMTSDDGSRMFVDGEKLIDNWGPHSPRTRTGKMLLEPGVYALVVEYFEASHGAELKLVAAIGEDGKYETLPPKILDQPSGDPDAPCR